MQFKFSKGSVATVCRWSEQISNCYVATYLSILCQILKKSANVCKNYSEINKGEHFCNTVPLLHSKELNFLITISGRVNRVINNFFNKIFALMFFVLYPIYDVANCLIVEIQHSKILTRQPLLVFFVTACAMSPYRQVVSQYQYSHFTNRSCFWVCKKLSSMTHVNRPNLMTHMTSDPLLALVCLGSSRVFFLLYFFRWLPCAT